MRQVALIVLMVSALATSSAAQPLEEAGRLAATMPRLHSLLVSWRGDLLLERYYNGARATRPANIKSASKSVISALVGIAIEQRHIAGVRQPIGGFFPAELAAAADAPKRAITIEDLLTMRAGLEGTSNRNYGAWVQSRNWVRFVLSRQMFEPPGGQMEYSTGSTHLLSAILTRTTGKSTLQFAQDVLARPLGFSLAPWTRDPQGIYFGGNEMVMTPKQMLAFGELYRNRGRVGDRVVVPERWVEESFRPRTRSRFNDQGYGYGWWSRQFAGYDSFFAWGYGGQYIFIVPELDLVVVTTSSTAVGEERRGHRRTIFDLLEQSILPTVARLINSQDPTSNSQAKRCYASHGHLGTWELGLGSWQLGFGSWDLGVGKVI
jgi:CubicO group peptidase (beta-lactamase class C family)